MTHTTELERIKNDPLAQHVLWPDWQAPANVHAFVTTRAGGVSTGCYASMNTRQVVGESPQALAENRRRIAQLAGAAPLMLNQVHGTEVFDADQWAKTLTGEPSAAHSMPQADAIVCSTRRLPIEIQTADCLPVLLAESTGRIIAAAHAGWRGLAAGMIENTVGAMLDKAEELGITCGDLHAYVGPCIGPQAFEVQADVLETFCQWDASATRYFTVKDATHWLCNLPQMAHDRLQALGVRHITLSGRCTYTEAEHFFSYRREKISGRMASVIWLA